MLVIDLDEMDRERNLFDAGTATTIAMLGRRADHAELVERNEGEPTVLEASMAPLSAGLAEHARRSFLPITCLPHQFTVIRRDCATWSCPLCKQELEWLLLPPTGAGRFQRKLVFNALRRHKHRHMRTSHKWTWQQLRSPANTRKAIVLTRIAKGAASWRCPICPAGIPRGLTLTRAMRREAKRRHRRSAHPLLVPNLWKKYLRCQRSESTSTPSIRNALRRSRRAWFRADFTETHMTAALAADAVGHRTSFAEHVHMPIGEQLRFAHGWRCEECFASDFKRRRTLRSLKKLSKRPCTVRPLAPRPLRKSEQVPIQVGYKRYLLTWRMKLLWQKTRDTETKNRLETAIRVETEFKLKRHAARIDAGRTGSPRAQARGHRRGPATDRSRVEALGSVAMFLDAVTDSVRDRSAVWNDSVQRARWTRWTTACRERDAQRRQCETAADTANWTEQVRLYPGPPRPPLSPPPQRLLRTRTQRGPVPLRGSVARFLSDANDTAL